MTLKIGGIWQDIILPDTTYLERHDCISLLDRPICEPDAVADAIRWPVCPPDRDVRGFQSVMLDLGARLGLPGMVNDDGSAKFKTKLGGLVSLIAYALILAYASTKVKRLLGKEDPILQTTRSLTDLS